MSITSRSKSNIPLSSPISNSFEEALDKTVFTNIQKCIELRDKYMKFSCQRTCDNPKNAPTFIADPPKVRSTSEYIINGTSNGIGNGNLLSTTVAATSSDVRLDILMETASIDYSSGVSELSVNNYPDFCNPNIFKNEIFSTIPQPRSINIGPTYHLSHYELDKCVIPSAIDYSYKLCEDGVFRVYKSEADMDRNNLPMYDVPSIKDFFVDLDFLLSVIADGPTKTFSFRRLKYLDSLFSMYILLNEAKEIQEQKRVPHRDFYNVRKVDTHIHHSSCMNQKHLLRFIKSKLKKCSKDVVIFRDNKYLTLEQVFESLHLTAYDLSIDTLDMHAHKDSFHRFDMFNSKYNPIGESRLREIFLKTDNLIQGRYLSELTKEVVSDLEASRYQMAEYRISIYGRSLDEWDKLAAWICDNQLFSDNVRWIIQVPRLYNVYKTTKSCESFEDIVTNVFRPLFEVTKDPLKHPKLHVFLQRVAGFDSVDDESKPERRIHKKFPFPKDWTSALNPPYSYYLYFLYANMASLNYFRKERGMNTFVLRPHSGEAGDPDHLAAAYLTSTGISHGILLRKVPTLQYLYYLMQIGIALSPLSNNALFLNYERNPFPNYFRCGLNVSLSTDDPLQFHYTKEPLIEEYSVAAQIWKLSSADLSEISRNSVLQSGFELSVKQKWLGSKCMEFGVEGNDIKKSNIPDLRIRFRSDALSRERSWILSSGNISFHAEPLFNGLTTAPCLSFSMIEMNKEDEELDG